MADPREGGAPLSEPVDVVLRRLDTPGSERPGQGQLHRRSLAARGAQAATWAVLGLGGGLVFLMVPILHLCTTWALPLLGLYAALRAWTTECVLSEVQGPCPACGQTVSLAGGRGPGPHIEACGACREPLEAELARS